MKQILRLALSCVCAAAPAIAIAHDEPPKETGRLGKVTFENSCAPDVQAKLNRAVAMLHSFWYSEAEKSFREVLVQDPSCGIATWGIAAILMSNPRSNRSNVNGPGAMKKTKIQMGQCARR